MQLYPAIDLKGGRVARVFEGERTVEAAYGDDPLAQAVSFIEEGATRIHVVDMDRALGTGKTNSELVLSICALENVEVQVGGNIGSLDWGREVLNGGASRVVLGTATALEPSRFAALVQALGPHRCALAVDVRGGRLARRDRTHEVASTVEEVVGRAREAGVQTIVYRDLTRDGLARGADVAGAERVGRLGVDVILAGGVASLDDLRAAAEARLAGVIVGRALYEGRFSLREALACSS